METCSLYSRLSQKKKKHGDVQNVKKGVCILQKKNDWYPVKHYIIPKVLDNLTFLVVEKMLNRVSALANRCFPKTTNQRTTFKESLHPHLTVIGPLNLNRKDMTYTGAVKNLCYGGEIYHNYTILIIVPDCSPFFNIINYIWTNLNVNDQIVDLKFVSNGGFVPVIFV